MYPGWEEAMRLTKFAPLVLAIFVATSCDQKPSIRDRLANARQHASGSFFDLLPESGWAPVKQDAMEALRIATPASLRRPRLAAAAVAPPQPAYDRPSLLFWWIEDQPSLRAVLVQNKRLRVAERIDISAALLEEYRTEFAKDTVMYFYRAALSPELFGDAGDDYESIHVSILDGSGSEVVAHPIFRIR
jgi:hypothetical protein